MAATPLLQLHSHILIYAVHTVCVCVCMYRYIYNAFWIKVSHSFSVTFLPPLLFHTLSPPSCLFLSLILSSPSDDCNGDDSHCESQTHILRFQPTYLSLFLSPYAPLCLHLLLTCSTSCSCTPPSLPSCSLSGRQCLPPPHTREEEKLKYSKEYYPVSLPLHFLSFPLQLPSSVFAGPESTVVYLRGN